MNEEDGYKRLSVALSVDHPKIGYLGPEGTFTQDAAYLAFGEGNGEFVPFRTILDSGEALVNGLVQAAVVPCENSIEGSVNVITDFLMTRPAIRICGEIALPIKHNLVVARKLPIKAIKAVVSHPQALAQCRRWLRGNLGTYVELEAPSTAYAVANINQFGNLRSTAAIGTARAANLYSRVVLQESIEDSSTNRTRFWVIGRRDGPLTGNDRTVVIFLGVDDISAFLRLMGSFSRAAKVEILRVESRPTKKNLGNYHFLVEIHGHRLEEKVRNLLERIKRRQPLIKIRVVGSFKSVLAANSTV